MRHYTPQLILPNFALYFVFTVLFSFSSDAQSVVELIDRSDLAIEEGAYIEALGTLSKVLEQEAENSKAHNLRGVCFEKLEQFQNAEDCYQKAIRFDEGYPAPYFNLGLVYMNGGRERDAIALFSKYILLKPLDATGWTQKGISYLYNEQLDSALYFLNRAIDLDPASDRALMYRGYCWSMLENFELAIRDLDDAIRQKPTSYNYFVRANLFFESGELKKAISDYSEALTLDPQLVEAQLSRANAYLFDENYYACLSDVAKILEKDPGQGRALNYQAWAYFYLNDYAECARIIKEAKAMTILEYNFDHLLGRCYLQMEEFEEAALAFEAAIALEPIRTDNYQLLAAARILGNTPAGAIQKTENSYLFTAIYSGQTEKMVDWVKDPENPYFYDRLQEKYTEDFRSLGYDEYFMFYFGYSQQKDYRPYSKTLDQSVRKFDLYFEQKDYQGCVSAGEDFLKENPFVLEMYLYIGSAYYKMNNYEKYGEYMFKYHALLESINFTGTGKTMDSAYIIIDPSDEYDLLYYLGYHTTDQSILHKNGHDYDVLKIVEDGSEMKGYLYFNIDMPYQSLTENYLNQQKLVKTDELKRLNIKPRN